MALEIEHKYLTLNDNYKTMAVECHHLIQGYLCSDGKKTVRIRLWDDTALITIKGPSADGGLSRFEYETEIDYQEGLKIIGLCDKTIDKHRYIVPWKGLKIEVDEFHGFHEGLVIAEIEVPAVDYIIPELPPFMGKEVTGDRHYYNSYLCKIKEQ